MSNMKIWYKDKMLHVQKERTRVTELDYQEVYFDMVQHGRRYPLYVKLTKKSEQNKVFFMHTITKEDNISFINEHKIDWNEEQVIAVFSVEGSLYYCLDRKAAVYKKMLRFYYKMLHVSFSARKVTFWLLGQYINPLQLDFTNERICLGDELQVQCDFPVERKKLRIRQMFRKKYIRKITFSMSEIVDKIEEINSYLQLRINIDGCNVEFPLGIKDRFIKTTRYYYAPYKSTYVKDFAIHLRRTITGGFILVKRPMEPVENTPFFRFMESKPISWLLYQSGKISRRLNKKTINVFYEKLAQQAEEGVFEFFEKVRDTSKNSECYFIIDENSKDYERIRNAKNVIRKFSFKYYYLIFHARNYIATESPAHHLNITRPNNRYYRLAICENDFIFLQHGVTYMKCHGPNTPFARGKEAEPAYMIVDSEKEKDICVDMLKLNEEQMLKTGMIIFDDIKYKHINQKSEDIVTIMLTWKPYEEHLVNFEEATYYQYTQDIYNIVSKYVRPEKIKIVAHPKIAYLFAKTDMGDKLWDKSIKEVLGISKLLITDYSSVAYNCFYQGAGVIFYQPDVERYELENGPLIPSNEEYIGYRIFDPKTLEMACEKGFYEGEVLLDYWRTEEFEENYKTINEFSDGKNAERIFKKLEKLGKV